MDFHELGEAVPAGPELSALQSKLVHYFFPDKAQDDPSLSSTLFPAMTPVTLCRRDFQFLRRSKYWVIEKSDGDRCLLLSSNDSTYLIDHAMQFYRIDRSAFYLPRRDELTKSQHESNMLTLQTLLDGVLVYNHAYRTSCFMASDAVLVEGRRVAELTLTNRIAAIRDQVVGPFRRLYPPGKEETLPLLLLGKEYWPLEKLKFIVDKINHVEDEEGHRFIYESGKRFNENDGILFIPDERPYRPGRNHQVKKWKWPECNTVRFLMKLSEEYRVDGRPPRVVCKAFVANNKGEELEYREIFFPRRDVERLEAEIGVGNRGIVECYYDHGRSYEWRVRMLTYSEYPPSKLNYVLTIMESNTDRIMKEDLLQLAAKLVQVPAVPATPTSATQSPVGAPQIAFVAPTQGRADKGEDLTSEENHSSPTEQVSNKRPLSSVLEADKESASERDAKRRRLVQ